MKNAMKLFAAVALVWAAQAHAQTPTWDDAQTEVWKFVKQSWVDDAAENGKWPADYVHEKAISWGSDWPFSQHKATWVKWNKFRDKNNQTLMYELSPDAITIVNDTAVVNYMAVIVSENAKKEMERNVIGITETLVRVDGKWVYLASSDIPLNFSD